MKMTPTLLLVRSLIISLTGTVDAKSKNCTPDEKAEANAHLISWALVSPLSRSFGQVATPSGYVLLPLLCC